jgi:hypothetical protein
VTDEPVIRWRQAEGAPADGQTLSPAPASNVGFREAATYLFEKPGSNWNLRIDDEPLGDGAQPGWWTWSPRFFAGEVTAELVGQDIAVLFLLDVSPDPGKVGRDVFVRMIEELWAADPSLVIGHEPATQRIGDIGLHDDPWLEFSRFRRYVPEFLKAASAVRARPRRSLRVFRTTRAVDQIRRVDRQTAVTLGRSPAASLVLGIAGGADVADVEHRLDVPLVEETLDSAPNRAILALTLALIRRGRGLLSRLEAAVQGEMGSETETPLRSRWPVRRVLLARLTVQLQRLLRHSPFRDVGRPEITAAGLNAIAADPAYSRLWGRGWRALRHGVDAPPTDERLWMSPSWQIYERWCFLRLGRRLADVAPEWGWTLDVKRLRWSGHDGEREAKLMYQPRFPSAAAERPDRWSVSRQREPDLVLFLTDAQETRFVVFDAKYRSSRGNVLDAMGSAHVYQDSLRVGARRPEASFLLVPASGGASWLEQPAFHAKHRVGVVPFGLDQATSLPGILSSML